MVEDQRQACERHLGPRKAQSEQQNLHCFTVGSYVYICLLPGDLLQFFCTLGASAGAFSNISALEGMGS